MWATSAAIFAALALQSTAALNAKVDSSRSAYLKCMRAYLHDQLKAKTNAGAFNDAAATACQAEQTAFHTAMMASDRAMGLKPADAKASADDEVANYVDGFREKFVDFRDQDALPNRD